ncbi:putative hyaluronan/mRNA-binding protein [Rosa chinensis]|uniref:Putative hyaluronan/mRNA-binding protein n=1 Tax=Rosa chinensis TaxID=74649 RepID=A0A2P6SFF8_ROSCH|nr:RGG repeats nuclear RNA binding protein A [Rosa chinensis]PRQ57409.1 putative hyaluronan/mRNA-binding protein [Rosa chinensis]
MATMNPFDLLGDDDAEDPSLLVAAHQQKLAAAPKKAQAQPNKPGLDAKPAKLPSKPAPPSQAVRDSKDEAGRGGRGGGRGYGRGRGGGGYNRDSANNENNSGYNRESAPAGQGAFEDAPPKRRFSGGDGDGRPSERRGYGGDGEGRTTERRSYGGPRGSYHGGRRGGFGNGEVGDEERPRRIHERRSGTGRGNELKREGSGRGNWGSQTDEFPEGTEDGVNATEKILGEEKPVGEVDAADDSKETPANEPEEKEPEEKEMTLEEYEKVLEEKRKALQALKTEERKVDTKEFESLQQLSNKKGNDDIFIKLGSDKDKKKESAEKEEKAKKSVSINEFLKPAEGERFSYPSRGRGRGRGSRGGFSSNYSQSSVEAPPIEDPSHFPTLGGK